MSQDVAARLPLHPLTFRVLMALTDGPSFGTAIVKRIEDQERGTRMYPANLFRRIRDLVADGLVEECAGPPDADSRRTYLQLTDMGRRVARAEAERLSSLVTDARAARLLSDG